MSEIINFDPRKPPPAEKKPLHFVGLDLGQIQDFSAITIMERLGDARESYHFNCVHLQRWPLRTPYPTIVADTVRMMNSAELQNATGGATLAVDATGVGAPVIDLFRQERFKARLTPIQITGGADVSEENGLTRVPKRNLVSTVQVYLQSGRFKVAGNMPETETLLNELQNFQVKISDAAHDSYGAWRDGTHDDLVLAAALALWSGSRGGSLGIFL